MGVSISGIVIKKVIKDDFNNFENCFRKVYPNFRLEFEKEIVLESMLDRKRGSNYIDLYYTNSGTFMTFDENALEGTYWIHELSENSEIVNFDICETSMTFHFSKYFNNKQIDTFNIFNGQIHGDDFLNISDGDDIFWDILPLITQEFIGEKIHDIDQGSKCFRYKIFLGQTQNQINEEKIREEYRRREEKQSQTKEVIEKPKKKGFWNWLKN